MEVAPVDRNQSRAAFFVSLLLCVAGCGREPDAGSLPSARTTLIGVGKRLGSTLSPEALTALGEDETKLIHSLTSAERDSLSRASLRFRVDRRVTVDVAVNNDRAPFWLVDLGFQPTCRIGYADGPFRVWSRRYEAGVVGLGVNSLDRRPRGQYTVFVRAEGTTPRVELLSSSSGRVVDVTNGIGPYSDDARPFLDLPAAFSKAVLIQTRRDRRHESALVQGRVWKTRLPSGPAADQVVVSFGDDPARSLTWTWRTDSSVTNGEIKLQKVDTGQVFTASGAFLPIESDGLLNDPIIHRHRAVLTNLEPDTDYRYSIRDGSRSGLTEWKIVHTAPASDRDYSFLAMGDPQCGLEEWGKLLHAAHDRYPSAGFLVIAGDLVDRGNERSNWDHFFLRAAGVFDELPLMPCVGNHEYLDKGPDIYSKTFAFPANGPTTVPHRLSYAFEYSDSFVAVLDSNPAVYSKEMARRLADWLDGEFTRTKARWKFVVFHHPVYPSHPSRDQPQLASAWIPVFDKHHVDLVLQGHDHAYLRTYPMRADSPVAASKGTVYVVSVSGQKFVPLAERSYTARGFADVATYQSIEISPRSGTLTYRALDVDGRELDRLEIAKPVRANVAENPRLDPSLRRSSLR